MGVWSELKVSALAGGMRIDPEYYQPRYLKDSRKLHSLDCDVLGETAYVTDGIHGSPDEVEEDGIRYLSAKCVKNNDFSLGDTLWISKDQHAANPRTALRADDVLITTVGTIGNAAVVQPDVLPANSDRHLGIVRLGPKSRVNPYYLATFLNSEFGRFQTMRESTGNVQLNLFIEKIRDLLIPVLNCMAKVTQQTREAYAKRLEAAARVARAEAMMRDALRLGSVDLSPSLVYTQRLSRMVSMSRFGAEYYMPAKARVVEALAAQPHRLLSDYVINVREFWRPEAGSPTELVRNFDLGHAMEPFLDDSQEPVEAASVGSAKKKLKRGDIVISRLRSYLKQIAIVRCGDTMPIVGSSEFIVLRPKGELSAEALLTFLRCSPVQTVLKWSQDGTNHPRFDERELLNLPVPDAIIRAQEPMSETVGEAIAARQKMATSLAAAGSMIEQEIRAG